MDAGSRKPHSDPPQDVEVGPVLTPRATRHRLVQGATVAVAIIGVMAIALWLAGASVTSGPSRTAAVRDSIAAASPTASPTEVARATMPSAGPILVVPAVPCNTRTPPPTLGVTLIVGGGPTYAGSPASNVAPPDVPVPNGAELLLILGAEDCAAAWDVEVIAEGMNAPVFKEALVNPDRNPAHGMQNRWQVTPLSAGNYLLNAHLIALDGESVVGRWRLHVGDVPTSDAPTAVH